MLGGLVDGVLLQRVDEELGAEDVDAHGREVRIGLLGLLGELDDLVVVVRGQDAEAGGLLPGHGHDGDREVGVVLLVSVEHLAIIHAVELVAREDEHVLGVLGLDVAQVLGHGVCRARVPCAARLRRVRREDRHASLTVVEVPRLAGADVGVKQIRPVLRENTHGRDT